MLLVIYFTMTYASYLTCPILSRASCISNLNCAFHDWANPC